MRLCVQSIAAYEMIKIRVHVQSGSYLCLGLQVTLWVVGAFFFDGFFLMDLWILAILPSRRLTLALSYDECHYGFLATWVGLCR